MISKPLLTAIAMVLASALAAAADEPIPAPEHRTLDQYGAANKACLEWSDGCAVCLRKDDGSFGCSLPGIACLPGELTCRAPLPEKAPETPPQQKK